MCKYLFGIGGDSSGMILVASGLTFHVFTPKCAKNWSKSCRVPIDPVLPQKKMITMRILMVQNLCNKEGFVSGGVVDGENFGLKAKKKTRKRNPKKCPKGHPDGNLGESASHHLIIVAISFDLS